MIDKQKKEKIINDFINGLPKDEIIVKYGISASSLYKFTKNLNNKDCSGNSICNSDNSREEVKDEGKGFSFENFKNDHVKSFEHFNQAVSQISAKIIIPEANSKIESEMDCLANSLTVKNQECKIEPIEQDEQIQEIEQPIRALDINKSNMIVELENELQKLKKQFQEFNSKIDMIKSCNQAMHNENETYIPHMQCLNKTYTRHDCLGYTKIDDIPIIIQDVLKHNNIGLNLQDFEMTFYEDNTYTEKGEIKIIFGQLYKPYDLKKYRNCNGAIMYDKYRCNFMIVKVRNELCDQFDKSLDTNFFLK